MIEASCKLFEVNSRQPNLQAASLSFDASVLEIFMALLGGATLYLSSRDRLASELNWASCCAIVPSQL
jgi:non-ribosomal peptide synthetase component F